MKITRIALTLAVVAAAAGVLSGCTSQETFPEAKKADLPQVVSAAGEGPVDGTVRILGEDKTGYSYYVGQWSASNGTQYCVVMVKGDDFSRGCNGSLPVTLTYKDAVVTLDTTQAAASGSVEQVGPYVTVRRS